VVYGLDDGDEARITTLRGLLQAPFVAGRAIARPPAADRRVERTQSARDVAPLDRARGAVGSAGLGLYACRGRAVVLMRRVAMGSIFRDTIAALPAGFHVGFCGTGSPFPRRTRSDLRRSSSDRRLFLGDARRRFPGPGTSPATGPAHLRAGEDRRETNLLD
jgi:hypothetical protein